MHGNCTRFVRELRYEEVIEIERLCRSRNRDIRDRAMVIKLSSQMIPVPEITEQLKSCLLYTSPSPRDISGSRMPSSA